MEKIKDRLESRERRQLVFKYISLAIANARDNFGRIKPSSQMKDIQKKLGLSHKRIILEAAKNATR